MVTALKVLVSARKDGKVLIALRWTKMLFSVYQIVRDMEPLILTHKLAIVKRNGVEMIVQRSYVIWIVANMDDVLVIIVSVMLDGMGNSAAQNYVIRDATNMGNAKMELAYALLDGTENTVQSKVVQMDVPIMDSVKLAVKVNGSVDVMKVGMDQTALSLWS